MRRDANPNHRGDEEYNYFLAVIFPHDQMKILPYNRVVKDLGGLEAGTFLERVRERFEIREPEDGPEPGSPGSLACIYAASGTC